MRNMLNLFLSMYPDDIVFLQVSKVNSRTQSVDNCPPVYVLQPFIMPPSERNPIPDMES